jgi:hypothetical protein
MNPVVVDTLTAVSLKKLLSILSLSVILLIVAYFG